MTNGLVKSAARVMAIFECFEDVKRPLTISELVRLMGVPQSSMSALMKSLLAQGFVDYDTRARTYTPSVRVGLLGSWLMGGAQNQDNLLGMMQDLNAATGDTAVLGVLNGVETQYIHVVTEAMRRAYSMRALHLGDPDFNPDMPVARLISQAFADTLRQSINMNKATPSSPASFAWGAESEETTHFSVVDDHGNAVSNTYTLEYWFGSRIVIDGTGFLLNNEMGDFNPWPGHTDSTGLIGTPPNRIRPQKRMLSSMTPSIVTKDGKLLLVIGSPGGRTIINTVLLSILNVIDFDMNVLEAIDAPRFHHQWLPDKIRIEKWGVSADVVERLRGMGHKVDIRGTQGRAMGIYIDPRTGIFSGAADPRSPDGGAVGY